MAAANGFVTTRPDERYGTADGQGSGSAYVRAQKFTAGGTGTQNVTRIGFWGHRSSATAYTATFAIYTHDSANNCPEALVTNSQSSEVSLTQDASDVEITFAYSTQPQVTGGSTYWLVFATNAGSAGWYSRAASGGTACTQSDTFTYPTLPTGDAWHTHTDGTTDGSIYAVYQEQGAEPPATGSGSLLLMGVG